mgnify:CR=1 FL=1
MIFGGTENHGTVQNVSETAAKRDSPGISVYVISSNPPLEKKIRYMFRDVPAKIFKLKNTDFFTPEQGVYPTMGVDRVAALYGAKLHYTLPALVIDGGTAMVRFCLFVCLSSFDLSLSFFWIRLEPSILRKSILISFFFNQKFLVDLYCIR